VLCKRRQRLIGKQHMASNPRLRMSSATAVSQAGNVCSHIVQSVLFVLVRWEKSTPRAPSATLTTPARPSARFSYLVRMPNQYWMA
jgi:hypothetical protein